MFTLGNTLSRRKKHEENQQNNKDGLSSLYDGCD